MAEASALTEKGLRSRAGSTSFVRGQDYVRYVHGLRVEGSSASASIQARSVYLVDLEWSDERVEGTCTCPHHARGHFCKHLVAVGLAVIDSPATAQPEDDDVLDHMDADALRQLVRDLREVAPEVGRLVQLRAAGVDVPAADDDPERLAVESARLLDQAKDSFRVRGFIDYRRSFDVAAEAQQLLDELERLVESGRGRAAQEALLHATKRLRMIIEHTDDSAGVLGDAGQRAAELYARACLAGHPDPAKLARWLLKFRETSPGWPDVSLADFVGAFDDQAMRIYRRGVERLRKSLSGAEWSRRHEADRMRLELADHDDDVDAAVAILSEDADHVSYGAILTRLRDADREDEVGAWVDRAVAAGRVSPTQGGNSYWVDPGEAATDLLRRGREDDALGVLRAQVLRATDVRPYQALLDFAAPLGRRNGEEAWAKAQLWVAAERDPYREGAMLVQIALAERDLDEAWRVVDEFGAGHAWQSLCAASAKSHPSRAAALRRSRLEPEFAHADTRRYRPIARELATIRDLMASADENDEFATYLADIRQRYSRRTTFVSELDRQGLR